MALARSLSKPALGSRIVTALAVMAFVGGASGCGDGEAETGETAEDTHGHGHDSTGETGGGPVPTATMAECPDPAPADTYDNFADGFFETYCRECHLSTLVGAAERQDAPTGVDFDNPLMISMNAADIDSHAGAFGEVVNEIMPPAPAAAPSMAEREQLAVWIECGQP